MSFWLSNHLLEENAIDKEYYFFCVLNFQLSTVSEKKYSLILYVFIYNLTLAIYVDMFSLYVLLYICCFKGTKSGQTNAWLHIEKRKAQLICIFNFGLCKKQLLIYAWTAHIDF